MGLSLLLIIFVILFSVIYRFRRALIKFLLHSKFIQPIGVRVLSILCKRTPLTNQSAKLQSVDHFIYKDINFRDMMLGVAVGDAFGAGIEMQPREWMAKNVDFSKYIDARGIGPHALKYTINYTVGLYTDDTEMTLGLVKALLSGKKVTEDVLLDYWRQEFRAACNWFGVCRQGHGSIKEYFLGASSLESVRGNQRTRKLPGNAPTMRAVPLGLLKDELEIIRIGIANAMATHPHPKACASSLAVAWATKHLVVLRGSQSEVISYVLGKLESVAGTHPEGVDQEFLSDLRKVDQLPDYHTLSTPTSLSLNWKLLCGPTESLGADAMHTAFCVLYMIKYCTDAMDLLKIAIRIGGDVDSVASVCLGIYGGWRGLDIGNPKGIPKWMIDPLEGVDELQYVAAKLKLWYEKKLN